MQFSLNPFSRQTGASMIEVLVTLVILLLGLLGLAGLMIQGQRSELESYQRVQALILLQDIVDRIEANRRVASCYAVTDAASGSPYFGNGSLINPTCVLGTSEQFSRAIEDMRNWNNLLLGSSETKGGNNAGAMIGARGCVSIDTSTTPPTYRVSVAWQGRGTTIAPPTANCAIDQFGDESQGLRRVVSVVIRMASLS